MATLPTPPPAPLAARDLDPDSLADTLLDTARGGSTHAAVWLLVAHDLWTRRRGFLDACTRPAPSGRIAVDFAAVAAYAHSAECSASSKAVLLLAAELAGIDTATAARELFAALDRPTGRLVVAAIRRSVDLPTTTADTGGVGRCGCGRSRMHPAEATCHNQEVA